jgi:hypothetical protein
MPNLFGLDIAKIVANSIASAGGVLDATLTKTTPGTRTPGNLTGGTNPTTVAYVCQGFKEDMSRLRPEILVEEATGVITLLGKTISSGTVAPEADDLVTIESQVHTVLKVTRDPAAAVYQCQVK